jgi:hypothetical protein
MGILAHVPFVAWASLAMFPSCTGFQPVLMGKDAHATVAFLQYSSMGRIQCRTKTK